MASSGVKRVALFIVPIVLGFLFAVVALQNQGVEETAKKQSTPTSRGLQQSSLHLHANAELCAGVAGSGSGVTYSTGLFTCPHESRGHHNYYFEQDRKKAIDDYNHILRLGGQAHEPSVCGHRAVAIYSLPDMKDGT